MAGTDFSKPFFDQPAPVIILVEPQLPENIGMAARAMANFGLRELRLVRPREVFPCEKAYASSAKAHHIIDNAVLYDDLTAALADMNYVCATTARPRYSFKPVYEPAAAARLLHSHIAQGQKGAIMFGRERFGLSNEEISLSDIIVSFPVNPAFASLNIAQAVLLMGYEWLQGADEASEKFPKNGKRSSEKNCYENKKSKQIQLEPAATKEALYDFFDQLEEALQVRGYFRPPARKKVMVDNLRAVLTKAEFGAAEIRLLRGVVSSLDRFSPTHPRGSGAPLPRNTDKDA